MIGCYYLHTNGDLIFKPEAAFANSSPAEVFDSPFVVKWWEIPTKPPSPDPNKQVMWFMDWMREAYELSSDKSRTGARIYDICRKQDWPDMIPKAIIEGREKKQA